MYRVELTSGILTIEEIRSELRAHLLDRPFIDVEGGSEAVVILMRGNHIAELMDLMTGVSFAVEPAGASRHAPKPSSSQH